MPKEFIALIIFVLFLVLAYFIFRANKGWFWLIRRRLTNNDRIMTEDILKYFAENEIEGLPLNLQGAAGALSIAESEAGRITSLLIEQGLLKVHGSGFKLSKEGLDYGLSIIRAHRLYETYMAEHSGFSENEWHEKAHHAEHRLTEEDVNEIDKRLNFPIHDPHGDPIPTPDGYMKTYEDKISLCDMQQDDYGWILHIEDEPKEIYSQLAAEGLYPGLEIRVLERDDTKIRFWAGSDEHVLSILLAANVQLIKQDKAVGNGTEEQKTIPCSTLADCSLGGKARIVEISPRISGTERRRLMDLGFLPGTLVEKEIVSAAGDPMGFRIRDTLIAIRRSQAEQILAEPAVENDREGIA